MKVFYPFLILFYLLNIHQIHSQNYLRVIDPNGWNTPVSTEPGWQDYASTGKFDDITIIVQPQGVYTEVEIFATISQGDAEFSWNGNFEIIWQFELPKNSIVHDSWLWVGSDIIKADVVDYWTALETYTGIVNQNSDPSFFYQLQDNRYEIRIFPLPEGASRKIKMSFLVPATWSLQTHSSELLQNLFKSTYLNSDVIKIGMPVNDLWTNPKLKMGTQIIPITETITGGTGDLLHFLEVSGTDFIAAEKINFLLDAPLSGDHSFLSTYVDQGEQFFQLAYLPDWEANVPSERKKSLILLDFNDSKTSLTSESLLTQLQSILSYHFTQSDSINIAVTSSNGIHFLSESWYEFDNDLFIDELANLLVNLDSSDLEQLLTEGYTWAQNHTDVEHIYLLAANDEFVYPPVADDVFEGLESLLIPDVPFSLLDYQDENVSILFYNNEEYHGNEYFYQLLTSNINESETILFRESNQTYSDVLLNFYPTIEIPTGLLDFTTSLDNGIAFQRYNLNNLELNSENRGVILQTGKFLGDFPMTVNANLITDDGQFFNINHTISTDNIIAGDSLMREMWFGSYLKELEATASTTEDFHLVIQESINERVLTGFTAFLALEPDEGGEPCIDCLLNNDWEVISTVDHHFEESEAKVNVNPNPVIDKATIQLTYSGLLKQDDWTATIFDISGRTIKNLALSEFHDNRLIWEWSLDKDIQAGIYFCKIKSEYGMKTAKIIVLTE